MDHPNADLALPLAGDRDAEQRQPMRKVGGAIERVNDPARGGVISAVGTAFFGENPMVREATLDRSADDFLGGAVEAGDQVGSTRLVFGIVTAEGTLGEDATGRLGHR